MATTTAAHNESRKTDRNALAAQICGVIAFVTALIAGVLRITEQAGLDAVASVIIATTAALIAAPALLLIVRKF